MSKKKWIQVRVDSKEKARFDKLASELGTEVSTLVRIGLNYLDGNRTLTKWLLSNGKEENHD